MANWLIAVSGALAHHYELAAENGLWDFPKGKAREIAPGDGVYFWLTAPKGRFAGRAVATTSLSKDDAVDDGPWDDAGNGRYVARVLLDGFQSAGEDQAELRNQAAFASMMKRMNVAPRALHADEVGLLEQFFGGTTQQAWLATLPLTPGLEEMVRDLRRRVELEQVLRDGQARFKEQLLRAYGAVCAVTGSTVRVTLQGAHILGYRGLQSNVAENGLLLRADIHLLFDAHLLSIDPDGVVHVSRDVPEYREYDGQRAHWHGTQRPNPEFLHRHNTACRSTGWMATPGPSVR